MVTATALGGAAGAGRCGARPRTAVLTLRELGVLRAVHVHGTDAVEVDLTPTYTGCPAIEAMSVDIERVLRAPRHARGHRPHGAHARLVDRRHHPGRTRETPGVRHRSPRVRHGSDPVPLTLGPTRTHRTDTGTGADAGTEPVRCPHCGSADTELLSRFSSTACKALAPLPGLP